MDRYYEAEAGSTEVEEEEERDLENSSSTASRRDGPRLSIRSNVHDRAGPRDCRVNFLQKMINRYEMLVDIGIVLCRSLLDFSFIVENDFSGGNPENRASLGATLMQRKLAIG
ncbi:hypothetical protein K0M31_011259 [Melipona bicolor]|uniref:Uncharacterized protein n=1 Tax=Melipona bicolor TaxID=60889 RepID=A0AA40GAF0_9HYME|nr:hypothetical protein K0M31_011259 [Melipona bicolor]